MVRNRGVSEEGLGQIDKRAATIPNHWTELTEGKWDRKLGPAIQSPRGTSNFAVGHPREGQNHGLVLCRYRCPMLPCRLLWQLQMKGPLFDLQPTDRSR